MDTPKSITILGKTGYPRPVMGGQNYVIPIGVFIVYITVYSGPFVMPSNVAVRWNVHLWGVSAHPIEDGEILHDESTKNPVALAAGLAAEVVQRLCREMAVAADPEDRICSVAYA